MFVFIVASKSSEETSRTDSRDCCRAALFTTISRPPSPFTARFHQFPAELLLPEIAGDGKADAAFGLDQRNDLLASGSSVGK